MPDGFVVLRRDGEELARWPLPGGRAVLATVDALARLQLAARRRGCSIVVREPGDDLAGLLDLVGLGVEVGGQPELLEEPGVEEAVLPDDPVAGHLEDVDAPR